MISSYVKPDTVFMTKLFHHIAANGTVVKNNAGDVYWPDLSINTIGLWDPLSGYQLYTKNAQQFAITGTVIDPLESPITLVPGVNIVPYLRASAMDPATAFAGLSDTSLVVFNECGNMYWPSKGISTLASLQPGHAYALYIASNSTLTYPANDEAGVSAGGVRDPVMRRQ
jgi:hypothetical protein